MINANSPAIDAHPMLSKEKFGERVIVVDVPIEVKKSGKQISTGLIVLLSVFEGSQAGTAKQCVKFDRQMLRADGQSTSAPFILHFVKELCTLAKALCTFGGCCVPGNARGRPVKRNSSLDSTCLALNSFCGPTG